MSFNIDKCPNCGCMIYDPFRGDTIIHDVSKCADVKLEQTITDFGKKLLC